MRGEGTQSRETGSTSASARSISDPSEQISLDPGFCGVGSGCALYGLGK
jgi:hypothetical protein